MSPPVTDRVFAPMESIPRRAFDTWFTFKGAGDGGKRASHCKGAYSTFEAHDSFSCAFVRAYQAVVRRGLVSGTLFRLATLQDHLN